MSRFPTLDRPEDPDVKSLYQRILPAGWQGTTEGVPMNAFTAFGERTDILESVWTLTEGIVMAGGVPPTVKQMISMTIAMQSNCRYCAVAHTHALEMMGVPTEVIQSCASDPEMAEIPPVQRAIVQFALKVARDSLSVTEEDIEGLREHGLSDGDIIEVVMLAAWSRLLNMWTDVSGVLVDGEA